MSVNTGGWGHSKPEVADWVYRSALHCVLTLGSVLWFCWFKNKERWLTIYDMVTWSIYCYQVRLQGKNHFSDAHPSNYGTEPCETYGPYIENHFKNIILPWLGAPFIFAALYEFAGWCNGNTKVSGSFIGGSNPPSATLFDQRHWMLIIPMSWGWE